MSGAMWSLADQQRFQGVADALDLLRDDARRLRDSAPAAGRFVAAARR